MFFYTKIKNPKWSNWKPNFINFAKNRCCHNYLEQYVDKIYYYDIVTHIFINLEWKNILFICLRFSYWIFTEFTFRCLLWKQQILNKTMHVSRIKSWPDIELKFLWKWIFAYIFLSLLKSMHNLEVDILNYYKNIPAKWLDFNQIHSI